METLANVLSKMLRRVLAGLLALLVMVSAVETAAWALFEVSWAAATEIQGLLLATFALLAAAYGVHQQIHLGVDVLVTRLPSKVRWIVARGASAVVCGVGLLLAFHGGALVGRVSNTLPATGWPAAVGYLPAVLGGLGIAFFAAVRLGSPRVDDDRGGRS